MECNGVGSCKYKDMQRVEVQDDDPLRVLCKQDEEEKMLLQEQLEVEALLVTAAEAAQPQPNKDTQQGTTKEKEREENALYKKWKKIKNHIKYSIVSRQT